ncbi:cytochrome C [Thermomonas sp.]
MTVALLLTAQANAVPSYARQTGVACSGCHVGGFGPQLTAFGRQFKLNGYTQSNGEKNVPLSVMEVESYSHTSKAQPDNAGPYDKPNNNFSLQQVSLFLAGRISEHVGSFAQVTYSDIDRKLTMDNVDIRFAKPVKWGEHSGVFGVSINNNPGSQDAWNTSPAWRFPFIASALVPGPAAATLLEGGLGQQVVGASAYAAMDGRYYGEIGVYRSLSASMLRRLNVDDGGSIAGAAPYVRFNRTFSGPGHMLEVGLTGLSARIHPDRMHGPTNRYDDLGVDASYQYLGGTNSIFTIDADLIHERQRRNFAFVEGGADHPQGHVTTANLNASWYYKEHYGLTGGWFDVRSDRDTLLYAPNPADGSRTGKPDSSGLVIQADWTPFGESASYRSPWVNLRFGLQYTMYKKFNGASRNYDGFGRNASDNNTWYAFIWNSF